MAFDGFEPACGGLELHFAGGDGHGGLGGGGAGEFFACGCIADGVGDAQAAFDFDDFHVDADFWPKRAGRMYLRSILTMGQPQPCRAISV